MKILPITNYAVNSSNTKFNGKFIYGKYYTDEILDIAKKHLKENTLPNIDSLKKEFIDCLEESKIQPVEWLFAPFVWIVQKTSGEDDGNTMDLSRFSLGISTLGLTELLKMPEAGIRKLIDNSKADKKYKEILECMLALKKEEGK